MARTIGIKELSSRGVAPGSKKNKINPLNPSIRCTSQYRFLANHCNLYFFYLGMSVWRLSHRIANDKDCL